MIRLADLPVWLVTAVSLIECAPPPNRPPTSVQEHRFDERREQCERLRGNIRREEGAERGERLEGDHREAHDIHERLEELRRMYGDRCEL
jgi:hypothetical protein